MRHTPADQLSPPEGLTRAGLGAEARALSRPGLAPAQLVALLGEHGLRRDALLTVPFAVGRRAAVWWGCLCVWEVIRAAPAEGPGAVSPAEDAALGAALAWVQAPSEQTREAAREAGTAADLGTAAGCLAMAAAWSEGSVLPPGQPVIPTPPDLLPRLVGTAVTLAAVRLEPMRFEDRFEGFLILAREIAAGRNLWAGPVEALRPDAAPLPAGVAAVPAREHAAALTGTAG